MNTIQENLITNKTTTHGAPIRNAKAHVNQLKPHPGKRKGF